MINETTINGVGFRCTMLTWEKFSELVGCEFSEINTAMSKNPVKCMLLLYVAGNIVYTKGNPTIRNEYEADEYFNALSDEEKVQLNSFFLDSMRTTIEDMSGQSDKKKLNV